MIDSVDFLDELATVRSTYKTAFRQIVVRALVEVRSRKVEPITGNQRLALPSLNLPLNLSLNSPFNVNLNLNTDASQDSNFDFNSNNDMARLLHTPSRYETDFVPLRLLGKGSFGTVYAAFHKLDKTEYAVKVVRLCSLEESVLNRMLNEVRTLARLASSGVVVRYFSAWVEVFDNHKARSAVPGPKGLELDFETDSLDASTQEQSEDSSATPSQPFLQSKEDRQNPLYLFIQMQLCALTLADYLIRRNGARDDIDATEELSKFKDFVRGVEFLHLHKLVHRDIKPSNIFHDAASGVWMVGDLGLTTNDSSVDENSMETSDWEEEHTLGTTMVGTLLYSSSDQLEGKHTERSDIFSCGIILFELLYLFQTQSERIIALTRLRNGILPDVFLKSYPRESTWILWLTHADPLLRPTASQILASIGVDADLRVENCRLRRRIQELEAEVAKLKIS